jgi:hypothetical protein
VGKDSLEEKLIDPPNEHAIHEGKVENPLVLRVDESHRHPQHPLGQRPKLPP